MITLSYPAYDTEIGSIQMPSPDLEDTHEMDLNIIVHFSLNKTVRTVISKNRLGRRIFKTYLTFSQVDIDKSNELRQFLENSNGHYVKYVDHEGDEFIAIINLEEFEQSSKNRAAYDVDKHAESVAIELVLDRWEN